MKSENDNEIFLYKLLRMVVFMAILIDNCHSTVV